MSYPTFLTPVEREIRDERERQEARWGEQNHPDGTERRRLRVAGAARARCQRRAAEGRVTWRHILDEEVEEAFAEEDPAALREELIQVAAVAMAWAEAIDRRPIAAPNARKQEASMTEDLRDRLRRAKAERDVIKAATDRAKALHKPLKHGGLTICAHCSGWTGRRCIGLVRPHPCPTLAALDHPTDTTGETETASDG